MAKHMNTVGDPLVGGPGPPLNPALAGDMDYESATNELLLLLI